MKLHCEACLYCPHLCGPLRQSLTCLNPFLLVSKAMTPKKTILAVMSVKTWRQLILLPGGELGTPGVEWGRMLGLGRVKLGGIALGFSGLEGE